MAYEVMILCHLHMPLYFLGTFTEYPYLKLHITNISLLLKYFIFIIILFINMLIINILY